MYRIEAKTHFGEKKGYEVISKDLMLHFFKHFQNCLDVETVTVIDGFTGEVVWQWENGEYIVANGEIL